jgi:hypothetical protein
MKEDSFEPPDDLDLGSDQTSADLAENFRAPPVCGIAREE